ncbi:MAG TPA: ubiquitin-like protein Pup [Actinobacteria bacterium]|nr:ubiquitin-like protein Pup [Actinomycetota bacterium]
MAEQERKRTARAPETTEAEAVETADAAQAKAEELTEKIDDLLDEIDTVLEENAEEFVKNYVQKGGE